MVRWLPALLAAGLTLLSTSTARADDWPQFLGPARNGVSRETGLLDRWPAGGPKILWRSPLGVGMSSISVSGQHALTMFQDDTNQFVVSLNTTNGQIAWKTAIAPKYENAMGHGPRATPAIDGDAVFAFSGEGVLAALSLTDGKSLWSVNVPKSLEGEPSEYGMSCSPIVAGQLVIVHAGTQSAAVAGFDKATGKLVWKAGQGHAGYSSPVLMTLAGLEQIVALTGTAALGIEPASGRQLWRFPFETDYGCNTASPVKISDKSLLISAGESHGTAIIEILAKGDAFDVREVWTSYGRESRLRAEWQTPVVVDGYLYGLDNIGAAGPITNLTCIRLADGNSMWRKDRFGKSNLMFADGKLFLSTMKGEVAIVRATHDKFDESSRAVVVGTTRQAPVISDGRMFVRDDHEVVCIQVRQTEN